jgi:hypothetical protein
LRAGGRKPGQRADSLRADDNHLSAAPWLAQSSSGGSRFLQVGTFWGEVNLGRIAKGLGINLFSKQNYISYLRGGNVARGELQKGAEQPERTARFLC